MSGSIGTIVRLPAVAEMHSSRGPFRLWVLCLSETCHAVLARLELPDIELIPLAEFERDDVALTDARSNRSLVEYHFTCTPSLPRFVFHQFPEVDRVTYLDSDLFFFNDPELVHNEIGDHSIAIIPHGFPSALVKLTRHGICLEQELHRLTRGIHYWIPPALTIGMRKIEKHMRRLRRRLAGS